MQGVHALHKQYYRHGISYSACSGIRPFQELRQNIENALGHVIVLPPYFLTQVFFSFFTDVLQQQNQKPDHSMVPECRVIMASHSESLFCPLLFYLASHYSADECKYLFLAFFSSSTPKECLMHESSSFPRL